MWILLATSLLIASADVEVTTLAGARTSGPLVRLTSDEAVLGSAAGEVRFAAADLLAIKLVTPASVDRTAPTVWIDLIDDSRLWPIHPHLQLRRHPLAKNRRLLALNCSPGPTKRRQQRQQRQEPNEQVSACEFTQ
jgi:hypothetical protein